MTITLDGVADDGEAGEADNVGADVEGASGGARQRTRSSATTLGNRLLGGGGNDSITGGTGEDRIEGNEGDDTIDSRDGRYDSIDCGPGNDTLLADPGDGATNCEIAPDRDGDGTLNAADCAPDNAAIHPGAGEIVGNAVDEDCKDGPLYLQGRDPDRLEHRQARRASPRRASPRSRVREVKAGDKVEIRCIGGKSKALPVHEEDRQPDQAAQGQVDVAQAAQEALPQARRGGRDPRHARERDRPRACG